MEQVSATTVILVAIVAVLTALVLRVAARGRGSSAEAPVPAPTERQSPDDDVDYRELAELTRQQLVEAELRTLRAQISPHFIYNSLNAIAATIPADPVRARELVIDFADFTRYSLRAEGDFSTLEEELSAVERYVLLEKARFEDRVQVNLEIAPEVLSLRIPFLSIQPLVENALRHGADSASGQARVRLIAQEAGTHAVISVEDEGPGAEPGHLERVLAGAEGSSHIGLRNVDLRLRQAYGGDNGLRIDTAPGAGMRVSMRVPKFQQERS
ncbi:two-component system LytT family sensor kinase [Nesterenkonia lacusekhoensis]|uniref:Two-component system LytT family sensor kinase n=1 Tax=Nesterenkonia lacusekhoensis TaxID=150832 RepID=A0ABS4T287_9MICC|nr:two-component system LytT family sensor kinase [Nesterenkonia lacusekhoensis]